MAPVDGVLDVDVAALERSAGCVVVGASHSTARRVVPLVTATTDTVFRVASLTKPVTAVATVLALARAGLALDTPAIDLLPDLRESWNADERLSVADLLSQTSGLASKIVGDDVTRLGDTDGAGAAAARLVVQAGSARPPRSSWEYYNGNYFVVGAIVESLTGMTFEEAVAELVLQPWGLSATSFDAPPDIARGVEDGVTVATTPYPRARRPSGGLCSTAGDLLTFGERLLGDSELLDQLRTVRTRPGDTMRYGLGWAIGPSGQMYLNGRLPGCRAALLLVPDHSLVGVSLAADSGALPAQAALLNNLQHHLTGDDLAGAIDSFAA